MKDEKPKVIIKFEPAPNFEEEFLEFVEEVLSWDRNPKKNEKAKNQQSKNARKNHVERGKKENERTKAF